MNFLRRVANNFSLFFSKIAFYFKKYIIDIFKDKDLLKRILYTLSLMILFVVIGSVTLPGVKINENAQLNNSSFLGILNTVGGGGLRQFSLVALGIGPFISASLIMTFAKTKLIPPLYRLANSGQPGRMKLNIITHAFTLLFSLIQAIVIIQSIVKSTGNNQFASIDPKYNQTWFIWFVLPMILVSGTFFSIFLSEQITNKGIGNGTSILILTGTIISLPRIFTPAFQEWVGKNLSNFNKELVIGIVYFTLFILLFISLMFFVSFLHQAERKIPIQHVGSGRSKSIKDLSYLPIKINPAGIMPIIFASMLVTFPMLVVDLINELNPTNATAWMKENFQLNKPIGLTIFAVATFSLTIFLGLQQSRLDKIVEDFNKNSTFIPGIRPGEQTEDYLISIIIRLSIFSAFYLTIFGTAEYLLQICGVPPAFTFGGSTIMILVTTSIETIQQIEARYKSENIFKSSIKANKSKELYENIKNNIEPEVKEDEVGGSILW